MSDYCDALIFELIIARPADEPAVEKIHHAVKDGLTRVYAADREALAARTRLILNTPPLLARLWEQQYASERFVARALAACPGYDENDLRTRVIASACLAAVTTAALV